MISAGSAYHPTAGGIIRYYRTLLDGLVARPEVTSVVAFVPPWDDGSQLPRHPKVEAVRCRGLPQNRPGRVLYEQTAFPLLAWRQGIDVLLSTCNVKPLLWRGASVVVLQSMQSFFLPDEIGRLRRRYLKWMVPRSLASADVVIAVSEAQRRDTVRLFKLKPGKVVAVRHGASSWAVQAAAAPGTVGRPNGFERPYVLTVSRLYGLKNHRRLIEAFARVVRGHDLDHELVVVGGDADVRQVDLERVARAEGVSHRMRFLGRTPQDALPALHQHADAIAYVSLYETFGHPVLEACAFGRPLVTSDVGGTAELAGKAARLVDPWSVESITEGLADVLMDEELRRRLSAAGPLRVRDFTWEACAEGTLHAAQQAIGLRGARRRHRRGLSR